MIILESEQTLEELIRSLLARWGISSNATLTLLSYSENATYLIQSADKKYVMRVHRVGYHTINGVRSELAWMQALRRDTQLETPIAIAGLDGEFVQLVDVDTHDEPRMVVLFEHIQGIQPEVEDLIDSFRQLGSMTAKMHQHAQHWTRPEYFERQHWDLKGAFGEHPNWGHWKLGFDPNVAGLEIVQRAADQMTQRLTTYGLSNTRYGLIHSDFRLANLLVREGETKILDFDDCGFGWYVYDLASSVSFLENHENIQDIITSWLQGYFSEAPLSDDDLQEIPTFMLFRRLILMGWAGSHPTTALAESMRQENYSQGTVEFAQKYLNQQVYDHSHFHQSLVGV